MHDHRHHGRGRGRAGDRRRLRWTLALAAGYMVAELAGAWLTNSLALLADAGHMLSDVAALALSWFAVWIADRDSPPHRTYGYYRAEILAALLNGAALVAVSVYVFVEAYRRLLAPPEVAGGLMTGVAAGGLAVNLAGLWILGGAQRESLNVRGAWLHVLFDALGSVGAVGAGLLIWLFGWTWTDPAASALIGLLIVYSSWRLVAEAVSVLMESAPRGVDVERLRDALASADGVAGVHDLHVWRITSGLDCLSAHVVAADGRDAPELLGRLRRLLHDRFGVDHITIQIEPEGFEERPAPDCGTD